MKNRSRDLKNLHQKLKPLYKALTQNEKNCHGFLDGKAISKDILEKRIFDEITNWNNKLLKKAKEEAQIHSKKIRAEKEAITDKHFPEKFKTFKTHQDEYQDAEILAGVIEHLENEPCIVNDEGEKNQRQKVPEANFEWSIQHTTDELISACGGGVIRSKVFNFLKEVSQKHPKWREGEGKRNSPYRYNSKTSLLLLEEIVKDWSGWAPKKYSSEDDRQRFIDYVKDFHSPQGDDDKTGMAFLQNVEDAISRAIDVSV
jgi:hypothetical protein